MLSPTFEIEDRHLIHALASVTLTQTKCLAGDSFSGILLFFHIRLIEVIHALAFSRSSQTRNRDR